MYNLRFYLDDDDNIIRCDYKEIADNNEIDLMHYNELQLGKEDLFKIFNNLCKNDINHKNTVHKEYIVHEFIVPSNVIKEIFDKTKNYKLEQEEIKRKRDLNAKRKYNLQRKNKFKNKRIMLSMATLLTISALFVGGVSTIQHFNDEEYRKNNPISHENVDETYIEDSYTIEGLVDAINQDLYEKKNYNYSMGLYTEDLTDTQRYIDCYNTYYQIIEKYAREYGIDPNIAIAIACYERAEHSNEIDADGKLGLFQIDVEKWDQKDVRTYSFKDKEWQTYKIETEKIRDLEENIKAAMILLQNCLRNNDYNIAMAITEFNEGHSNVMNDIVQASQELGKSVDELTAKGNDDWYIYKRASRQKDDYTVGVSTYLENVFKYVDENQLLQFYTPDNKEIVVKYDNVSNNKGFTR